MRAHQGFDTLRRTIEALGEPRHLVTALDLHARGQIARTERLDAGLQPFQPSRQAAHDRIGADGHQKRDPTEEQDQARSGRLTRRL